jgi:DNA uptake protein ComE-like DNA-binding protein
VPWWVFVSALPLALGAWAPLIPALQLRRPLWGLAGVLWCAIAIVGWSLDDAQGHNDGGGWVLLAWVGAIATTLAIRPAYMRARGSSFLRDREEAERRLAERREALRISAEEPALAEELGIGRPDRPGARHAGVIDANHVPASVLAMLPGIDEATASRIVEVREEIDGFSSLADMGAVTDLGAKTVERLRDRVVFLPR